MDWKKASAEKSKLLAEAIAPFACQYKKMFGYPAYFAGGNMFTGMHGDNIVLRLAEQDRGALLATFAGAVQFEPMPGRPMKEYIVLPESLYSDPQVLGEWLDRSFQYASSLPPKEPKPKKKR